MKNLWKKLHSKKSGGSSRSQSASDATNRSSSRSNSNPSPIPDPLHHVAHATNTFALATSGIPVPPQSRDQLPQHLSPPSSPVASSSHTPPTSPDSTQKGSTAVNSPPPPATTPGFLSTAYSGTKTILEVVRESSDVFVPLKSVAGGLAAIFKQYDVSSCTVDPRTPLILDVIISNSSLIRTMFGDSFSESNC